MYFSVEEYYNYLAKDRFARESALRNFGEEVFSKRAVARIHKRVMDAIVNRQSDVAFHKDTKLGREYYDFSVWKWVRPWYVVPALKEFNAPEGDFGIGIEIELGFDSHEEAVSVAKAVRNWKYITLDFEGGNYPIEATFPPTLYSKFGPRSQACRYLKLLEANHSVEEHESYDWVGTHINVSVGGQAHRDNYTRREAINGIIEGYGTGYDCRKYFGRRAYGGIRNTNTHFECKMFNSTTDWKTLRRYVDISVELIKLLKSNTPITLETVTQASELGYNRRG